MYFYLCKETGLSLLSISLLVEHNVNLTNTLCLRFI